MALIVEDGTIVDGANSYTDVQSFKDYHDARGNAYSVVDAEIEYALIKATTYIDQRWGEVFRGQPVSGDQFLAWPRNYVYDKFGHPITGMPRNLINATIEYAYAALTTSLYTTPTYDETGLQVSKSSVTVGPIIESVEYQSDFATSKKSFPEADGYIRSLIYSRGVVRT